MYVNTELLKTEAKHYLRYGYYCADPVGTPAYYEYWNEQLKRCKEGYSVGGLRITGNHYAYLNFAKILLTKEDNKNEKVTKKKVRTGVKKMAFPDFWDGDYDYFWVIEVARNGIEKSAYEKLNLETNIIDLDGGKHIILAKARRKGYMQPLDSKVFTYNGAKKFGNISVGDKIFGPNGEEISVTNIYPHGKQRVYEVHFLDGRVVECGKEHLWEIYSRNHGNNYRVKKILQTQDLVGNEKVKEAYTFFIRPIKGVEYKEKELPIDPYILGYILGDGNVSKQFKITSADTESIGTILSILNEKYEGKYQAEKDKNGYNYMFTYKHEDIEELTDLKHYYKASIFGSRINPVYQELKRLKLNTTSSKKRIPDIYKYSSKSQRLSLLQGILDSDGSINTEGNVDIGCKSYNLASDIASVCRSLGINCTLKNKIGSNHVYRVYIRSSKELFRLNRKKDRIREINRNNYTAITKVVRTDKFKEMQCISVDSKDQIYLTNDYIPTHNSYKGGLLAANQYNTVRENTTLIGAYEAKYLYPEGTMSMARNYLDFMDENTAWTKRRLIDRQDYVKSGYEQYVNGVKVQKGYKSSIIATTFKDNPHAARGKSASMVLLDEVGQFYNLKETYAAIRPTVESGNITTGQIILFGTGGDMTGGTIDFESMFYDPETYGLIAFENIWDEDGATQNCGWFFPDYKNKDGFMDKDGNSNVEAAKQYEESRREFIRKNSKDPQAIDMYIVERPFNPKEAFMQVSSNIFPVADLQKWRNKLLTTGLSKNIAVHGNLIKTDGEIKFKPSESVRPIVDFPPKNTSDLTGCVTVYQTPYRDASGKAPSGLYIVCCDPYAHDKSTGISIGATYVIKRMNNFSQPDDMIVASYVGRPASQDQYNDILFMLAEYYNAKIGFENDRGNVIDYAKYHRKLNWLNEEFEIVDKTSNVRFGKLGRKFGISMSTKDRKGQAAIYLRDWLLTKRGKDETGEYSYNFNFIYDIALLDELIKYNYDGNFDRVSALYIGMYYLKELYRKDEELVLEEEFSGGLFDRDLF